MSLFPPPVRLHYVREKYATKEHGSILNFCLELDSTTAPEGVFVEYKPSEQDWEQIQLSRHTKLNEKVDLWVSADIMAPLPIFFRLRCEIEGQTYLNDNNNQLFFFSKEIVIGSSPYVVPTSQVIGFNGAFILLVELACHIENVAHIECSIGDSFESCFAMSYVKQNENVKYYSLHEVIPFAPAQCRFCLYSSDGNIINTFDNHIYPITAPLFGNM